MGTTLPRLYTRFDVLRSLAFVTAGVLLAAAAYELALALGAWGIGAEPGEGAPWAGTAEGVALLATLVGVAVGLVCTARPTAAAALLSPAAGSFVAAREYTYDPYYAPTLRRYGDGGTVPLWWIVGLAAITLVVAVVTWRQPRPGGLATALLLLVWAGTALFASGH
jgi:hypothetical protein